MATTKTPAPPPDKPPECHWPGAPPTPPADSAESRLAHARAKYKDRCGTDRERSPAALRHPTWENRRGGSPWRAAELLEWSCQTALGVGQVGELFSLILMEQWLDHRDRKSTRLNSSHVKIS